jgi:hypothetical protein
MGYYKPPQLFEKLRLAQRTQSEFLREINLKKYVEILRSPRQESPFYFFLQVFLCELCVFVVR